jgi:hypothetical protein
MGMSHGERCVEHARSFNANVCGMKHTSIESHKRPNPLKAGPCREDYDKEESRQMSYEQKCIKDALRRKHQRETWDRTKRLLGWDKPKR